MGGVGEGRWEGRVRQEGSEWWDRIGDGRGGESKVVG